MPRRLSDELNELKIEDKLSGSEIVLYYRMPTTEERVKYTNALVRREGNRLVSRQGEARHKYGALILAGIRDGDFDRKVGDRYLPLSSTPGSENYDPEWKAQVKKHAPDLIDFLAVHVFEQSAEQAQKEDLAPGEGEDPSKN